MTHPELGFFVNLLVHRAELSPAGLPRIGGIPIELVNTTLEQREYLPVMPVVIVVSNAFDMRHSTIT